MPENKGRFHIGEAKFRGEMHIAYNISQYVVLIFLAPHVGEQE